MARGKDLFIFGRNTLVIEKFLAIFLFRIVEILAGSDYCVTWNICACFTDPLLDTHLPLPICPPKFLPPNKLGVLSMSLNRAYSAGLAAFSIMSLCVFPLR